MKKSRMMYFLMTGILLSLLSGGAWAYDFNDVTNVQQWRYNSVYGSGIWTPLVGNANVFDTFGADLSGNVLTIFSNWDPSNDGYLGTRTADLFIDRDLNGSFDIAIRLDTTGLGNIYLNPSYYTSEDLFAGTGYIYGGRFDQADPSPTPVWANSAATGSTSVIWTLGTNNLNNQVAVDLTGLNLVDDWSFVWGTATCSNDAINGQVPVPEPATLLLLGASLLGLGLVGRRRFRE